MIRNLLFLLGLVLLFVVGMATYHQQSIRSIREQPTPFAYWEDTSGTATVTKAIRATGYQPVQQQRLNVGYTESMYWVRFRITGPNRQTARELTLEVRNHTIDRLELFAVQPGRVKSLGRTGSRYPFAQRPSPTRTFAYLLSVPTHEQIDYYLRIDKRYENLTTDLRLWDTDAFENRAQREYFLWGIFLGVVSLIVGLAFLFYANTRDPVYGWYGLYVLALMFRQLADTGLGFQFVWPQLPAINHPDAVIMALWLYLPAVFQFQQYFLELRTHAPFVFWMNQVLKWAFWGLFITLVIAQTTGVTERYVATYQVVTMGHMLLTNVGMVAFVMNAMVALRSGDPVEQLYGIGFGLQTAGQLVVIAQSILLRYQANGLMFIDTYLIVVVNFFIDLVIFSFLLAHRYRTSMNEQRQLQLRIAQTQQQTNDAIIDVLESERQQVGSLLRTDVGGRLSQTRALLADVPPAPLLTEAVTLLDKTDDCLDQILRDSLPPDLLQKGLPTALADLTAQLGQTGGVRLSFRHEVASDDAVATFSATQTRQLYRIAGELLNNLLKHAGATEGHVTLRQTPVGWQLSVSDNGRGFDTTRTGQAEGIGLKNLYARVHTLGAVVQIESGLEGTTVVVSG
ncbi:7TM-DISM domain-containing protein [Spirosoma montaniterrae]|uniref:histidine kinase n=1 Tax=Spirosoma montaniterrae TaxID=1178516 RepID=A0A1P9WV24_9BACT|nr:7TM-DISM domain-containing protein [Spirosoma montaniterrae]AQG79180.1 hypothetical protein AWR27_07500 [Spirosoma montaniterrae]